MSSDIVSITDNDNEYLTIKLGDYIISYNIDISKDYFYDKHKIFIVLNIKDIDITIFNIKDNNNNLNKLIKLLNKFELTCINNYTYIPKKYNITNNIKFVKITYKKIFSRFLPYIPIIVINNTELYTNNNNFIKIQNKYLGIMSNNYIIPMIVISMIIKNYITNDKRFYILPYDIKYSIAEVNDNEYIFVPKDRYKLSNNQYINKDDYIYSIDNNNFNKLGLIYLPEINSSVHINTYMLLKGKSNINIEYTPAIYINTNILKQHSSKLPVKNVLYNINIFNSDKLKIPIKLQPIVHFRDKLFTVLSEELIIKYNYNIPIDIDSFNNYYSSNNFVILIDNNMLSIISKISGQNICNINDFTRITDKILSKNKRKFIIENINSDIPHTLYL